MANKYPSFNFYPNDWLSDDKVVMMTPTQRGGYIQLLCHAWKKDNLLKGDVSYIKKLSELQEDNDVMVVLDCFEKNDDETIYHKKLKKLITEKNKYFSKKSKAGKKGMKTRWSKGKTEDNTVITPPITKHNPSSSSSSSSSKEKKLTNVSSKKPAQKKLHLDFVKLTDGEVETLDDLMGQQVRNDYIQRLNDYIGSQGKRYKSHYHTIRNWFNRDVNEGKAKVVKKSGGETGFGKYQY